MVLAIAVAVGATGSIAAQQAPRDAARSLLAKLAKSEPDVTADLRTRAEAALQRNASLEREGDRGHALMAGEVALEWARAATALERAVATEQRATELERELTETETKLARTRALLEQANARKGRAEARLKQLEVESSRIESSQPADTSAPPTKPEPQ